MNPKALLSIGVVAAAIVIATIAYLQNFDAEQIACEDIPAARASLQASYDAGVDASVTLFREAKETAQEQLSRCLLADPADPCAAEQAARDEAYRAFFAIPSPADDAPYAEFKEYYEQREEAYQTYKAAMAALEQCWADNPQPTDVPYEESDTKKCFDAFDAAEKEAQDRFTEDTQTMRTALNAAMAALDAREKACNPPQGDDRFTLSTGGGGDIDYSQNIQSCTLIDADLDPELRNLRQRVIELNAEIDSVETSITNANKKASKLRVDLGNVDTYIPPESTKTQFEGALNALRAERKVSIEFSLEWYEGLIARKEAEKTRLESELSDTEARIAARLAEIQRENDARERNYPTNLRFAKPDECKFYHCHGTLCGIPDPATDGCGHGTTDESDVSCKEFFDAFLEANQ